MLECNIFTLLLMTTGRVGMWRDRQENVTTTTMVATWQLAAAAAAAAAAAEVASDK